VTCPNELFTTLTIEDAGKFRITRSGVGVAERNEPAGRFRPRYPTVIRRPLAGRIPHDQSISRGRNWGILLYEKSRKPPADFPREKKSTVMGGFAF
jgi:hypothetical protein